MTKGIIKASLFEETLSTDSMIPKPSFFTHPTREIQGLKKPSCTHKHFLIIHVEMTPRLDIRVAPE
jgi:hypothetical protein